MPYHLSFSLSLSLSSLCPFSLAHCNRLMFSHLRPIGALGADSSFLSFLVREGRPCYCDAEDIILIWLQQKAKAVAQLLPLAAAGRAAWQQIGQLGRRAGRLAWLQYKGRVGRRVCC